MNGPASSAISGGKAPAFFAPPAASVAAAAATGKPVVRCIAVRPEAASA
jgi:hypothetical protein